MMRKNLSTYFELTVTMVIVGGNIVIGKMIAAVFPVFLASALRFGIASLILLVILLKHIKVFPRIAKRDMLVMFLQSLTGNFLYSVFLLYGLRLTTAAESGIISGTVPAIVGLIAFLFFRERLVWSKWLGIGLVVVGMIAINGTGQAAGGEHGANNLLGNILIVGSVIGEALWTTLSKATAGRVAPLVVASVTSSFGFLFFLPVAIYQSTSFDFASVSLVSWGVIAYYGVIGTVGGYLLWYRAVVKVSAGTAGVFTGVAPVSAVVLSYVVLGEPFAWGHVVGGVCVLLAIVLIARTPQPARSSEALKAAYSAVNASDS